MTRIWVTLVGSFVSVAAIAHHSPNLHFNRSEIAEIAGVLKEVEWRNPHTQLTIATIDEGGREVLWRVEGRGAAQFLRMGLSDEIFRVGDSVRAAGFVGLRNPNAIFATNILLADGREVVAENFAEPRWTQSRAIMTTPSRQAASDHAFSERDGIFRVWGRDRSNQGIDNTGRTLWLDSYPLTERASAIRARWDRIADNPYIRCETGMPAIMDAGTPMEFVRDGEDIVLKVEEQDTVRRIHMNGDPGTRAELSGPLGYSVGEWRDDVLVVVTSGIDWPWFDQTGVPQTDAIELVETFTLSDDQNVLRYSVTATDPATFTEPVVLQRIWVWDPAEQIRPYDCHWDRDDL